jgi:hypothetical protein
MHKDKALGDIVKLAIGRVREINTAALGRIMTLAIQKVGTCWCCLGQSAGIRAQRHGLARCEGAGCASGPHIRRGYDQAPQRHRSDHPVCSVAVETHHHMHRDGFEFAIDNKNGELEQLRSLEAFKEFARKLVAAVRVCASTSIIHTQGPRVHPQHCGQAGCVSWIEDQQRAQVGSLPRLRGCIPEVEFVCALVVVVRL